MNDAQYTRYKNALNTRMSCLIAKKDSKGNVHFLIQSSQRYKVTIFTSGQVSCSCPDFACRSRAEGMVCKHVVFVLMRHLGVIGSLDHAFFRRGVDGERPILVRDEIIAISKLVR
jgi:hypothetical protein